MNIKVENMAHKLNNFYKIEMTQKINNSQKLFADVQKLEKRLKHKELVLVANSIGQLFS